MKQFLLAGIIALGVLSVYLSSTSSIEATTPVLESSLPKSLFEEFQFWKGMHNKRYSNEMIEDFRFRIFM